MDATDHAARLEVPSLASRRRGAEDGEPTSTDEPGDAGATDGAEPSAPPAPTSKRARALDLVGSLTASPSIDDAPAPPAERPIGRRLLRLGNLSDGSADPLEREIFAPSDQLAAFGPAILAIRWGVVAVSFALAAPYISEPDPGIAAWCALLFLYTVTRSRSPVRYLGNIRSLVEVVAELVFHVVAVAATGYWDSPLVFTLFVAVTMAGFARGFGFALRLGFVTGALVTIPYLQTVGAEQDAYLLSLRWNAVLTLVAMTSGWARHISGEADRKQTLALDRLDQLSDANDLLSSLHRVTQTLPASLEMGDVIDTSLNRLRGLFEFEASAVLVLDDTDEAWQLLHRDNLRLAARVERSDLPVPLSLALEAEGAVHIPNLPVEGVQGLSQKALSGMYAALTSRGKTIGLIAVEHPAAQHFTERDARMFAGLVDPIGLAIDNARWFARLRTVGADEERQRIARDLHDRIGQSLAYLAFELDRIVATQQRGDDLGTSLDQLRNDVRGVIGEVRDTLYDLRTDVTDANDIVSTLGLFSQRVSDRSGLQIELQLESDTRLPLLQEREMWRVAQEAITNVERHAGAAHVLVVWSSDGRSALLEVSDDGRGFPVGKAGRLDSYGILGMRERASGIGATLEIQSEPGGGSTVRCLLNRSE